MKLFVDNEYKGHHSEYLDILINYHIDIKESLVLAVCQEYYNTRKDVHKIDYITFVILKKPKNLFEKIREVRNISKIAKRYSVGEVFLLNFNEYFKTMFFFSNLHLISGIYFMPFLLKSNISKKEYYLKIIYFKAIFLFCNIKSVMILNDKDGVYRLNNYFKNNKFTYLTDPVFSSNVPDFHESKDNKLTLSFLGEVSPRKGIFQFLDALDKIDKKKLSELRINIVGNSTIYKEKVLHRIIKIKKKCPKIFDNIYLDRVGEDTFNSVLLSSNVVLCLHQQLEGSSGIVGKAAIFKKTIIGPKDGLIGSLISEYGLGVQINTKDSSEISKSILNLLEESFVIEDFKFEKYVSDHSPNLFVNKIIE